MLGSLWNNSETNISEIEKAIAWLEDFKTHEVMESDKKNLINGILDKKFSEELVKSNNELIDIAFKQLSHSSLKIK